MAGPVGRRAKDYSNFPVQGSWKGFPFPLLSLHEPPSIMCFPDIGKFSGADGFVSGDFTVTTNEASVNALLLNNRGETVGAEQIVIPLTTDTRSLLEPSDKSDQEFQRCSMTRVDPSFTYHMCRSAIKPATGGCMGRP
jgi:hypothetical protein